MKTVLPSFGFAYPLKVVASVVASFLIHMVVEWRRLYRNTARMLGGAVDPKPTAQRENTKTA